MTLLKKQPRWIVTRTKRAWLETNTTSNALRLWLAALSPIVGLGIDWFRRGFVPDWEAVFWILTLGPVTVYLCVFFFNFFRAPALIFAEQEAEKIRLATAFEEATRQLTAPKPSWIEQERRKRVGKLLQLYPDSKCALETLFHKGRYRRDILVQQCSDRAVAESESLGIIQIETDRKRDRIATINADYKDAIEHCLYADRQASNSPTDQG